MKKHYDFVFLGVSHGFLNDFSKEKELINRFHSEVILSEELEDKRFLSKKDFEKFLSEKKHSLATPFKQVKDLIEICYKKGIKLIGIDIENYGLPKEIIEKMNSNGIFNKKEETEIEKIVKKREKIHVREIEKFFQKSSKPIIVLLGAWHLREKGLISKRIKNSLVIYPSTKKGELVMGPVKGKIFYSEKELN